MNERQALYQAVYDTVVETPGVSAGDVARTLGKTGVGSAAGISGMLRWLTRQGYLNQVSNNGVPHYAAAKIKSYQGELPREQHQRPSRSHSDPALIEFADLKAVLGADQARDILRQITIAKTEVIVLSEEQLELAREVANGKRIPYQRAAKLVDVFRKFFTENLASARTFNAWLAALEEAHD